MEVLSKNDIQKYLVSLLIEVRDLCENNNIPYMLNGGTALGAIRHKGFIPWDDDIDIMMTRDNYNRFIELSTGNEKRKILSFEKQKNYGYPFAKYVDLSTALIENNKVNGHELGLYIDIFPIDGAGNNLEVINKRIKKIQLMQKLLLQSFSIKMWRSNNLYKKIIYTGAYVLGKVLGKKFLISQINRLSKKFKFDDSIYAGNIVWGNGKVAMEKEIFIDTEDIEFEGEVFKISTQYDKYLTNLYGDYMTPPPKEKQINHQMVVYKK